jgi:hypothetical protein
MFKMTDNNSSSKLNFTCLLIRYPREFEWLNDMMSFFKNIGQYYESLIPEDKANSRRDPNVGVQFKRKTLFITSEDMMLDIPGPNHNHNPPTKAAGGRSSSTSSSSGAAAERAAAQHPHQTSQAVIDIIRTSFSTVMMTPKPPIQTFNLSLDHVRLLFANNSLPLSAASEINFIQVMSIPGERALSVRITDEENVQGISSDVGDVSISMCTDSLSALQVNLGTYSTCFTHSTPPPSLSFVVETIYESKDIV